MKIQDQIDAQKKAQAEIAVDNSAEIQKQRLAQNDAFWKLIYNPELDTLPNYQPFEPRPFGYKANEMEKLRLSVMEHRHTIGNRVSQTAYEYDLARSYNLRQLIAPNAVNAVREEFTQKLKDLELQDIQSFQDITKNPLYAEVLALAQWIHHEAPQQEAYRETLVAQRKVEEKEKAKAEAEVAAKRQAAKEAAGGESQGRCRSKSKTGSSSRAIAGRDQGTQTKPEGKHQVIRYQKDIIIEQQKRQNEAKDLATLRAEQQAQNEAFMRLLYSDAKEIVLPDYKPFKASNGPSMGVDTTLESLFKDIRVVSGNINMWLSDQAKAHDRDGGYLKKIWPIEALDTIREEMQNLISQVETAEAKSHVDILTLPEFSNALGYRYWLATEADKALKAREKELEKRKATAERKKARDAEKAEAQKKAWAEQKKAAKAQAEAEAARVAKLQAEIEQRRKARQGGISNEGL